MDSLLSFVAEPLAYGFMQRALLMSVLIAVVCSIFSCFLILKGWSLMGMPSHMPCCRDLLSPL